MNIERISKDAFSVIGKEGSTNDGAGFIARLWEDANAHFGEIAALAKRTEDGSLVGLWGAMTDFSRSFKPWENGFSEGRYLAGVECREDAVPPEGWSKWTVPAYEYVKIECEEGLAFADGIKYLENNGLSLAGAAHDFTEPSTGKSCTMYPIASPDC